MSDVKSDFGKICSRYSDPGGYRGKQWCRLPPSEVLWRKRLRLRREPAAGVPGSAVRCVTSIVGRTIGMPGRGCGSGRHQLCSGTLMALPPALRGCGRCSGRAAGATVTSLPRSSSSATVRVISGPPTAKQSSVSWAMRIAHSFRPSVPMAESWALTASRSGR